MGQEYVCDLIRELVTQIQEGKLEEKTVEQIKELTGKRIPRKVMIRCLVITLHDMVHKYVHEKHVASGFDIVIDTLVDVMEYIVNSYSYWHEEMLVYDRDRVREMLWDLVNLRW